MRVKLVLCISVLGICFFIVGDGTVPMKISFGAQEPTSPRRGAGVGKGAEPPFYLADCIAASLKTALQRS